jgi:hypothetical protein
MNRYIKIGKTTISLSAGLFSLVQNKQGSQVQPNLSSSSFFLTLLSPPMHCELCWEQVQLILVTSTHTVPSHIQKLVLGASSSPPHSAPAISTPLQEFDPGTSKCCLILGRVVPVIYTPVPGAAHLVLFFSL